MKKGFSHSGPFTIVGISAPFRFLDELRYYSTRIAVDIVIGIPVLLGLLFMLVFKPIIKKRARKRILFGTVPIIIFKSYHQALKNQFDTTLFVMDDWSDGAFHDGLQLQNIAPRMISQQPYLIGPYYAFIWAILNFELFFLYFDSGFLERTIWWRIEPVLLQLYEKKTVMMPYGSDTWSVENMSNLPKKLGLQMFKRHYFGLDPKRKKRNFWWCKYATVVFSIVDFIKFLPRADVITLHGHILLNENELSYTPFVKTDKMKILHVANDAYRKGSWAIHNSLQKLQHLRNDFEYEIATGMNRDEILQKIEKSTIVIDTVVDGFIQYTTMEAALAGKIVMARLDHDLNEFFTYINPEYYQKHFQLMPILDVQMQTLEEKLVELLDNSSQISDLSYRTREFALEKLQENKIFLIEFIQMLLLEE